MAQTVREAGQVFVVVVVAMRSTPSTKKASVATIICTPLLWFPCRPKPDECYAATNNASYPVCLERGRAPAALDTGGEALLPLLLLHVAGALFTSWRHKENLLAAMLHGRKPVAGPDDVS